MARFRVLLFSTLINIEEPPQSGSSIDYSAIALSRAGMMRP